MAQKMFKKYNGSCRRVVSEDRNEFQKAGTA